MTYQIHTCTNTCIRDVSVMYPWCIRDVLAATCEYITNTYEYIRIHTCNEYNRIQTMYPPIRIHREYIRIRHEYKRIHVSVWRVKHGKLEGETWFYRVNRGVNTSHNLTSEAAALASPIPWRPRMHRLLHTIPTRFRSGQNKYTIGPYHRCHKA